MKTLTLTLIAALSAAVLASSGWAGNYTYAEAGQKNSGQAWIYHLHLGPTLTGPLDIDGFQTKQRLDVSAKGEGDALTVTLTGYRGDQPHHYKTGSPLFRLTRNGAGQLHTTWMNMQPQLANSKGGFNRSKT